MQDINSQNIQRFSNMLDTAGNIAIVTHMKPDGDAIGSSMAMYHYLRMSGKDSKVVLPHIPQPSISFLTEKYPEAVVIHETDSKGAESAILNADTIICLDFNAFHRTDALERALNQSSAIKILIDHHLNPAREAFDLIFSEQEISSASELLFHILMSTSTIGHQAHRLPEEARDALMTGMTTDTNNFGNSVYPSTLKMASELLAAGTDRDRILSLIYNRFSENRLRLLGHMMKDLLTVTGDGVAYIVLDSKTQAEYGIQEGDTEGFVNMPLSIENVIMSILLKEDDGKARVSIRSKKGTSANRCAMLHFNGGGHENAAGGRLRIPEDIRNISEAAAYIESHTHTFIKNETCK